MQIEASHRRTPKSPLTDHTVYHEALSLHLLAGEWPSDLTGHVFFTSPDIESGVPVFGSDGMVYRFDLSPRGVLVRSASTKTPSAHMAAAVAKQRGPHRHRFRQVGLSRLSPTLGAVECLNVAPTPVGQRMWITSDSGRPWEFDPVTLKLISPVGSRHDWRGVVPLPWTFPLILTSGHPAIDPGATVVWEANFSNMSSPGNPAFFKLLRITDGVVKSWDVVDADGRSARITQSVHQMASTEASIVILDSAFHVEASQLVAEAVKSVLPLPATWFGRSTTEAQHHGAIFWVIDRGDVQDDRDTVVARRYEIAGEATHFCASWSAPNGDVTLVVLHTPCQDVSEWVRKGERMVDGSVAHPDLIGLPAGVPLVQGAVGVHTLHRDGSITSRLHRHDPYTWGPALFSVPPGHHETVRYFWYYTAGFAPDALPQRMMETYSHRMHTVDFEALPTEVGRPSSLMRFRVEDGDLTGWSAPDGWGIFGLCFVPREGSEDPWDGYLFVSALSDQHEGLPAGSKGDEIWIFRAQHVEDGPIARLAHPDFNLPFTLHGNWMPRLVQPRKVRTVDLAADLDPQAALDAWAATLPAWSRASLRYAASLSVAPDAHRALLDAEVWPRFTR